MLLPPKSQTSTIPLSTTQKALKNFRSTTFHARAAHATSTRHRQKGLTSNVSRCQGTSRKMLHEERASSMLCQNVTAHVVSKLIKEEVDMLQVRRWPRPFRTSSGTQSFAFWCCMAWKVALVEVYGQPPSTRVLSNCPVATGFFVSTKIATDAR